MIPSMLVYLGEYLINQGIFQLIIYSYDKGWHLTPSSQYRWYQVFYQAGVFISRSSVNIILLPYWALILLPILQFANLLIFFLESLYFYIPYVWVLFLLILFEGLFGGSSYVNTLTHIYNFVKPDVREFSMSISSLGDAIGIVVAGFASILLYNYVCQTSLPAHLTA
ncbi:CLN3 family protein [Acanthocheilonema viteae]